MSDDAVEIEIAGDVHEQLLARARECGFETVDELLEAVGKNFSEGGAQPDPDDHDGPGKGGSCDAQGCAQPHRLIDDDELNHAQGCAQPDMVTFAVTFRCTREFLNAFRARANVDNRTLKSQVKQLAEDYAGMPAVPMAV